MQQLYVAVVYFLLSENCHFIHKKVMIWLIWSVTIIPRVIQFGTKIHWTLPTKIFMDKDQVYCIPKDFKNLFIEEKSRYLIMYSQTSNTINLCFKVLLMRIYCIVIENQKPKQLWNGLWTILLYCQSIFMMVQLLQIIHGTTVIGFLEHLP